MEQKKQSGFAAFLRLIGALVLIAAAALIVVPGDIIASQPRLAVWSGFVVSIGAAAALWALASLINRERQTPKDLATSVGKIQQQLIELGVKMNDLQLLSERARPARAPEAKDHTPQLNALAQAIAELRDAAMMPDAQRNAIAIEHRRQRREAMIKHVWDLVGAHEWPAAERELIALEGEYPNDNEVAKARHYLNHTRKLFEAETINQAIADVESLMTAGSYEQAMERARTLLTGFPHNPDAQALAARVERELNLHQESNIQRMFEEIKHDIDRRTWRRALMHAERMIDLYPNHRLTETIHDQLKTLMDNAEIEERQELEIRIQEHIRDKRFDQAIELSEEVIQRFPHSPQAESLETLLPRIRELASGGVNEFASLGASPSSPFSSAGPIQQEPTRTSE